MSKSEKAQAIVLVIGILLFGVAVGRTISVTQNPEIAPTPTISSPAPALTMPSGGETEDDDEDEEDDD